MAIGMVMIKRIKKRDGRIVNFEPEKIATAIAKAFRGARTKRLPGWRKGGKELEEQFSESIPGAEDVQDIVERALIDEEAYSTQRSEPKPSG